MCRPGAFNMFKSGIKSALVFASAGVLTACFFSFFTQPHSSTCRGGRHCSCVNCQCDVQGCQCWSTGFSKICQDCEQVECECVLNDNNGSDLVRPRSNPPITVPDHTDQLSEPSQPSNLETQHACEAEPLTGHLPSVYDDDAVRVDRDVIED
jgi:hypothetical protein